MAPHNDPRPVPRWRRPNRPTIPAALAARPIEPRRRLPIPYVNVHDRDGHDVADFTVINPARTAEVGRERRCGLCGTPLGYWIAFLGGPASARHRAYLDPPAHPDCAVAALSLCPHIARSHARRASPRRLHSDTVTPVGFTEAKPDEWVIGITRGYRMLTDRGGIIFRPARFVSQHRWTYDADGNLVPALGSPPLHAATQT